MITHNRLYEQICSFENLLWAGRRAERGKRMQDTIGRFRTDLEAELLRLRRALADKTYAPGPFRSVPSESPPDAACFPWVHPGEQIRRSHRGW